MGFDYVHVGEALRHGSRIRSLCPSQRRVNHGKQRSIMLPIIETFSGKMLDYENPTENMIDIVDIAHALSQICRFTGHCKQHYNVAQHSYLASYHVEPEHALQA